MPKVRLDSWKSIAKYLERSPRTVQRWHACNALPVHHLGGAKGSVFAFADEIDQWLVGAPELSGFTHAVECDALEGARDTSLELTSRALQMWEARSERNLNAIVVLYRKAIDHDPANARALSGLANAMISAVLLGVMDSSVAYPGALEAVRLARQIDPHDPQVHCCAAWLDMLCEHRGRQARRGFEWVLKHQPRCSFAMAGMALLAIAEGDSVCASEWAWKAWQQSVLVPALGVLVCWSHYLSGEISESLKWLNQVRMTGENGAFLAIVESLNLMQSGVTSVTIGRIETLTRELPGDRTLPGVLGYAYAVDGQLGKARELVRAMVSSNMQNSKGNAYGIALVHIGLGDRQPALRWLEVAFEEGSLWSFGFRSDPLLSRLRGDHRFDSLLSRIGATGAINRMGALELVAHAM
jgi:tetratricopeptide (TPR) repeat protein